MHGIKHIIVLMLENRSFDHMMGLLQHPDPAFPNIRLDDAAFSNVRQDGSRQALWSADNHHYAVREEPGHSHRDVIMQMYNVRSPADAKGEPTMAGFVDNHHEKFDDDEENGDREVMRVLGPKQAPVLHQLARDFKVCTNWYCSVPGMTWPNRFFAMSGQSLGFVDNDIDAVPYKAQSVFHELTESQVDWRVYHDGACMAMFIDGLLDAPSKSKFRSINKLSSDIRDGYLPPFSWVEPDHLGQDTSSQHPHFMSEKWDEWAFRKAEETMALIYNALRDNPERFNDTVFLITYDEHGGFYDHAQPPRAENPYAGHVHRSLDTGYAFDFTRLGPRVPAVLVSPRFAKGGIDSTVYDHAAIIRMVQECFMQGRAPLTGRVATAGNPLFDADAVRQDVRTLPKIVAPDAQSVPGEFLEKFFDAGDGLMRDIAGALVKLLGLRRQNTRPQPHGLRAGGLKALGVREEELPEMDHDLRVLAFAAGIPLPPADNAGAKHNLGGMEFGVRAVPAQVPPTVEEVMRSVRNISAALLAD